MRHLTVHPAAVAFLVRHEDLGHLGPLETPIRIGQCVLDAFNPLPKQAARL